MCRWIARDKDGSLFLYARKPVGKFKGTWVNEPNGRAERITLSTDWFPDVKWEDPFPRKIETKVDFSI